MKYTETRLEPTYGVMAEVGIDINWHQVGIGFNKLSAQDQAELLLGMATGMYNLINTGNLHQYAWIGEALHDFNGGNKNPQVVRFLEKLADYIGSNNASV